MMSMPTDAVPPAPPRHTAWWILGVALAVTAVGYLVYRLDAAVRRDVRIANTLAAAAREGAPPDARADYRQIARIETGMAHPRGIALGPEDTLYVAGDRRVAWYGPDGAARGGFALDDAPQAVAVGADGVITVAMRDHVARYAPDGATLARWERLGPRALLTAVAVGDDTVWAADAGNAVVLRYDATGVVRARIGQPDAARHIAGLRLPSPYLDLAVAANGTLWVTNPGLLRVEGYARDGTVQRQWGAASMAVEGFCGCCNPTHLALLPDGGFVTAEKGLPRVKTYTAAGVYAGLVAGTRSFAPEATGLDLAVDRQARIYVLDPPARVVRLYEKIEH